MMVLSITIRAFACSIKPLAVGASVTAGLMLPACNAFGPRHVTLDRFNYNEAIATSANEQMLLNVVRLRYSEVPVFLAVNSVLTQYNYSAGVGVTGTWRESTSEAGGIANLSYVERPTITYTPLTGQEFARQLIAPVTSDLVFSLVQSGWPPDQLLIMTLQRLNDVENSAFVSGAKLTQLEKTRAFLKVVDLFIELAEREAVEMQREEDEAGETRYVVFDDDPDPETRALIDELKDLLGLDREGSVFLVTTRIMRRGPEELTLRVRSLLELMAFLSHGVDIPDEHVLQERAVRATYEAHEDLRSLIPLRIRSHVEPPVDAFAAVEYEGHWFYIPHSDHRSKQAFGLLVYLFQTTATPIQGAGPLVTVPAG
jgi:hypothetical protein